MEFHTDIEKARSLVEESIKKFGYAPEHNVDHYIYSGADYKETVFVRSDDGSALLTHKDSHRWDVFSEPVAPEGRRVEILVAFISEALKDGAIKRVGLELYYRTRRDLLQILPEHLRARSINYTLNWPVFDLAKFDPELPGGRYKDLRNARSAFYREHRVEVTDARTVPKDILNTVVDTWKRTRKAGDRAYTKMYAAYIKNNFRGTTHARAFIVDGHVAGINAGWSIPNPHTNSRPTAQSAANTIFLQNSNTSFPGPTYIGGLEKFIKPTISVGANTTAYYAAIGLHDYSAKDLGDILNLEDLAFLKAAGYTHADFAGGEKALTKYKLKFGDAEIYKSHVFSIVRK